MADNAADTEWLVNQIAHALRNPVFAALVQAEALSLRYRDMPEASKATGILRSQLKRLEESLDDMLLYGRPARCEPVTVRVDEIVAVVADLYRKGQREEPAEVEVEVETAGLDAQWDPSAVRIILERLLDNAVQHTPPPHRVTIRVRHSDADNHIEFSIRDQGEGIPPDVLDKVFLPFFPQHRGRPGLGLAIAQKLTKAHGGTLTIDSEPGSGTEARCVLPRASDLGP